MSLRSANFASLPVLTQDSQGPQTVAPDQALTAAQILCIGQVLVAEESASKNWYKTGKTDIPVFSSARDRPVKPLSEYSSVIANMKSNSQILLYVKPESVMAAKQIIGKLTEKP